MMRHQTRAFVLSTSFALCLALLATLMGFAKSAQAYPEFIGYGYTTCLTCHYNGQGSGPLTDYGRALWSGEIASRALYPNSMTDDQITAQSGFLGTKELPYWLRPSLKYRSLQLNMNPGLTGGGQNAYYQMQADFGVAVQDKLSKYVGVITFGRIVPPSAYGSGTTGLDRILAREYYARVEIVKTLWVYAGLLEKAFGLRNIDHTSYQRTYQGFNVANNDINGIAQSQGIIVEKETDTYEVAANYFIGNPYDDSAYKSKGFSLTSEMDVGESKRLGASILSQKSDMLSKQMVAIHYRQRISPGSALMFEYGLIQDNDPTASGPAVGSYNLVQGLIRLTRGYNLKLTVERYNKEFKDTQPENWKSSFGFLVFPAPRFEFRLEAVNDRNFSAQSTSQDSWALEGQIHVSL